MKIRTHNFFSVGALTLLGSFFTRPAYSLISAVIISYCANMIIDKYGHEKNGLGMSVRSYRTHSPVTALFWGFLPALILFIIIYIVFSQKEYFVLFQGLLVGELHLFLDIITEGGIFINRKRVAYAHFRYNNPLLNLFFIAAGIILAFSAFKVFTWRLL